MTMMKIALAKAQALPSTIDERRAKIRKASLTTQKKSRDSSCCLSFSFCVAIAIILCRPRASRWELLCVPRRELRSSISGGLRSDLLTTENQTEHETDSERGKDCLRRV